ncbi:MAG: permease-like cell division protein FtsX [Tenuifilaceae bacterium]|uniref:cell division protein FtsX n=1 Tax=Perlabentimonas gracilis TaxID=2715279 RepID=UPI00140B892A|nr:permease-like cell division protein FtsX [Perlabentimonas gracilis]MDX9769682.1 permease-like cell division protein FtsX [Tenuifilaceae bacterium]NHB67675.1 cell division protein FtsX [Perlabentimonas gracilis]
MKAEKRSTKWRLRSSYLSSIISNALVLFMLGVLMLLIFNAQRLSTYVKENIGFSVILHDDVREVDANFLRKTLDASPYVRLTEYVTKEEAARELQQELGEDFIGFLGYNPLSSSIEVRLKADYANPDSIRKIEDELMAHRPVKEVFYQKSLVNLINENVQKISAIILLFSGLMLFVAIVLINNTIRLSVYSKRFLINTMKLVGATWGFIRKPFLVRGMLHGFYASLLSLAMLGGVIYLVQHEFYEVINFGQIGLMLAITGLIILLGIIINLISTSLAVGKYLRLKADELYY